MMPKMLSRYLNRLFLLRCFVFTVGLSAILSIFDLLANAGDVTRHNESIFYPLMTYVWLRFPGIVNIIIPLAGLLAALSVFTTKVMSQEMIAVRSVGISIYQVVVMMIGGGLIIILVHFTLLNFVLPNSAQKLHLWSEMEYRGSPPENRASDQIPNWIAAGNTIIKLQSASTDGTVLKDLSVITRQPGGPLKDYFTAREAVFENGGWTLKQVQYPSSPQSGITSEKVILNLPIKPGFFARTIDNPESLGIAKLWQLASQDIAFEKPSYVYQVWLHQKFSQPAGLLVMILLAAPLGLQLARKDTMMIKSFYVICGGFLFFIFERLIATLGEGGFINAGLAAWSPAFVFAMIAGWILLMQEN